MRGHQIDNELISLSPSSFESLQVYLSKFKSLVLQLKQCDIDKEYEQLILAILSKLGPDYSVFVSTFHATKLTVRNWNMPSLAYFMESFIQEQDKLVLMGTIKPSKDQYLVAGDSKFDSKGKKKAKKPPNTSPSLNRSPQTPRRITFKRRKGKVKVASAHSVVIAFILRSLK